MSHTLSPVEASQGVTRERPPLLERKVLGAQREQPALLLAEMLLEALRAPRGRWPTASWADAVSPGPRRQRRRSIVAIELDDVGVLRLP